VERPGARRARRRPRVGIPASWAACHRSTPTSSRPFAVSGPPFGDVEVLAVIDDDADQDQAAAQAGLVDQDADEDEPGLDSSSRRNA
jgi:hypothetical protein